MGNEKKAEKEAEKEAKMAEKEKKKAEMEAKKKKHPASRREEEKVEIEPKVLEACNAKGKTKTGQLYSELLEQLLRQAKKQEKEIDQMKAFNLFVKKGGLYHPVKDILL